MDTIWIILICVVVYAIILFFAIALAGANGRDEDEM